MGQGIGGKWQKQRQSVFARQKLNIFYVEMVMMNGIYRLKSLKWFQFNLHQIENKTNTNNKSIIHPFNHYILRICFSLFKWKYTKRLNIPDLFRIMMMYRDNELFIQLLSLRYIVIQQPKGKAIKSNTTISPLCPFQTKYPQWIEDWGRETNAADGHKRICFGNRREEFLSFYCECETMQIYW